MRLEVEKRPVVEQVSVAQVRSAIAGLRSYGPSSYASLTDDEGNYLQVAGGGITCMLERRDVATGRHYRAYHDVASKVYPDGTILAFGGGEIKLLADEWFTAPVVADVFVAFVNGHELPPSVKWRDVTATFTGS
ncbi:hypothetical protein D9M09_10660 [Janthinobacterium agaricidamnosum]|uniref:Uncharacterized protein n=1 Tax=Janthinobacterium agaricidamnosum TaxID=55508 RepID=A0A3G2E883_9BURK|nr:MULTISPECIES: hypothetical protein [Janthinobacterium]AYM76203.1 hypothetical protein D9M09_10660 [Janthinobacterium agaricidamnosum]